MLRWGIDERTFLMEQIQAKRSKVWWKFLFWSNFCFGSSRNKNVINSLRISLVKAGDKVGNWCKCLSIWAIAWTVASGIDFRRSKGSSSSTYEAILLRKSALGMDDLFRICEKTNDSHKQTKKRVSLSKLIHCKCFTHRFCGLNLWHNFSPQTTHKFLV